MNSRINKEKSKIVFKFMVRKQFLDLFYSIQPFKFIELFKDAGADFHREITFSSIKTIFKVIYF